VNIWLTTSIGIALLATAVACSNSQATAPQVESADVIICLDGSTSFPEPILVRARFAIADLIESKFLKLGGTGATIWTYWITTNTPNSPIDEPWHIPPIANEPTPPDLSDPKWTYDPEGLAELITEYQTEKAASNKQLTDARVSAEPHLTRLREASSPQAEGSDVLGCLQKAGDVSDHGHVLAATDAQVYGSQNVSELQLDHLSSIAFLFHYCATSQECADSKEHVLDTVNGTGGDQGIRPDITFYDVDRPVDHVLD
jgi:hypothetical protein